MGGRVKQKRRADRRAELPPEYWSDSTAPSVDDDSVGKPYAERDEKGAWLLRQSTDTEGRWFLGDIIRKKGTMCSGKTKQRDWGGSDTISDSDLTRDSTNQVTSESESPKKTPRIQTAHDIASLGARILRAWHRFKSYRNIHTFFH